MQIRCLNNHVSATLTGSYGLYFGNGTRSKKKKKRKKKKEKSLGLWHFTQETFLQVVPEPVMEGIFHQHSL